ncbi:MAG: hypothetical protein K0U84_14065 [Actinomycetia bacterium]|nr:hypothetical protein [Actinomycetes bacterium]
MEAPTQTLDVRPYLVWIAVVADAHPADQVMFFPSRESAELMIEQMTTLSSHNPRAKITRTEHSVTVETPSGVMVMRFGYCSDDDMRQAVRMAKTIIPSDDN